jgi:hypothetical protein
MRIIGMQCSISQDGRAGQEHSIVQRADGLEIVIPAPRVSQSKKEGGNGKIAVVGLGTGMFRVGERGVPLLVPLYFASSAAISAARCLPALFGAPGSLVTPLLLTAIPPTCVSVHVCL